MSNEIDYSKIPTADLEALLNKDYSKVSTATLEMLAGSNQQPSTYEERAKAYGEIKKPTPWYVEAIRPAFQTIGLVGGALVGGSAGTAVAPVAGTAGGAVVGAGLGYAQGNQAADLVEEYLGYKKPVPLTTRLSQAASDVGTGGLTEYGGQLVSKGVGLISKNPAVNNFLKIPQEQRNAIQAAKDLDYYMTPAQETGAKSASLIEKALSYVPGSAGIMQKKNMEQLQRLTTLRNEFINQVNQGKGNPESVERTGLEIKNIIEKMVGGKEALRDKQVQELADSLLKRLGSTDTYESLGLKTQEILNRKSAEAVAKKNLLYQEIGKYIPEGNLETPNINKIAEQIDIDVGKSLNPDSTLRKVINRILSQRETGLPTTVKVQGKEVNVAELPPQIRDAISEEMVKDAPVKDWNQLQKWRAELTDLIKGEDLAIKSGNPAFKGQLTPEGRIYKQLKTALDKDFEEIASKGGLEALEKLKTADAFYKDEFAPIWKNKDIQRLAYSKPSVIVDTVFRPGNIEEINIVKKVLGSKGYDDLHKKFVSKVFEDASKNGEFTWEKVYKEFSKYGNETLQNIFTPEEWKTISTYLTKGMRQESLPVADRFLLDVIRKSTPEQISNMIFHPNNERNIELIKRILPKDVFDEARANWVAQNILKVSKHDQYLPITSSSQIFKNKTTINAVLTKEEQVFIDKMFQISKSAENVEKLAGNPSGTAQAVITFEAGRMVISGAVGTAVGVATGDWKKAGTAMAGVMGITLVPKAMAKLYLSPVGRKLIEQGLKLPANSPQATKLVSQIFTILGTKSNDNKEPQGGTQ